MAQRARFEPGLGRRDAGGQFTVSGSGALLPRSPYAVTKLAAENYCRVYSELHGLETVALRYFNVYGPRQRPDSMYAAVIPLFIHALRSGQRPIVHGVMLVRSIGA